MRLAIRFLIGVLPLFLLSACPPGDPDQGLVEKKTPTPVAEKKAPTLAGVKKAPTYTAGALKAPVLSYDPPAYTYESKPYRHPEYRLPLRTLPDNYQRDLAGKFNLKLSRTQIQRLLKNGALIVPGKMEHFEKAYRKLNESKAYPKKNGEMTRDKSGIPTVVTTDSVMHLFHIQFNELLKNIEINKLVPMLKKLLEKSIGVSLGQVEGLQDKKLQELARRNVAFLSVAMKLLDSAFPLPDSVAKEVGTEIAKIEAHKGFLKNELFSKDCPDVCAQRLFPEGECSLAVKGTIEYQGKQWRFEDLYREVCSKSCACEDYSQYVPRGHYTVNEELKGYFKAMMWLGRMSFKIRGEGWTKRAILLTDAVKAAGVMDLWKTLYTVTGFFAGSSDDLSFFDYDRAVAQVLGYGFDENQKLAGDLGDKLREQITEQRGPKILGGFKLDTGSELKDATQGLRFMGQRYAIDSHVLSELVYSKVGPNPQAPEYKKVLDCRDLSQPKAFYHDCENLEKDQLKYFNEICTVAKAMHLEGDCGGLSADELYRVCRFMPSGLDVMSAFGSKTADKLMDQRKLNTHCGYSARSREMKNLVAGYDLKKWTANLYNAWLWMTQPMIAEKPKGYPNWMRSGLWKKKELVTALASWAQLRHDTILYVKQSYTELVFEIESMSAREPKPMKAKYYGYVEPNPALYARAGYLMEYLQKGLKEQKVMTPAVAKALKVSRKMMARLQAISEKELSGKALSESDYDYIESIHERFDRIISDLASALIVKGKKPKGPVQMQRNSKLTGKDDAFKTTIVADVHTDANTRMALEVGSGAIDWVIVAHESKNGRVGLAIGPMFSYYEFPHPMDDRLTEEKWREMLKTKPPKRPGWIADLIE